jgi:flagellar biosynthesis regulator FlaF
MRSIQQAIQAYQAASRLRPTRQQEADVFRHVNAAMRRARQGRHIEQVRALADNRRVWMTVLDQMRDPKNALPSALKASIISVGLAVQRDMEKESPDFDFLIAVNENIANGLMGR